MLQHGRSGSRLVHSAGPLRRPPDGTSRSHQPRTGDHARSGFVAGRRRIARSGPSGSASQASNRSNGSGRLNRKPWTTSQRIEQQGVPSVSSRRPRPPPRSPGSARGRRPPARWPGRQSRSPCPARTTCRSSPRRPAAGAGRTATSSRCRSRPRQPDPQVVQLAQYRQ